MRMTFIMFIFGTISLLITTAAVVYLFILTRKSLGEVLKKYRTDNKMTQEFVAESLGVSRQAVSKWEQGISEPSTSNMIALAKLYRVTPEELLKNI